jgi:hypothetical protein
VPLPEETHPSGRSPEASFPVKIASWLGGEHWYIDRRQFLHLEDAIAFCERSGLDYEIVTDAKYLYRREGD